ncbi:MAG: beta strand repeat-containing protein, partial [Candidatus Eutrophobiaceae bacterium]
LEFNGGEIAMVEIATVDDAIYEGNEDYTATLSAPTGATLDTDNSEDGTLVDNDTPILSLSGGGRITEGENIALTVTSNIAFASTAPSPMARLTVAGSEVSDADFSGDWNSGTDDVSLNFSNMTATVTIPTADDTTLELAEGYTVTLTAVARQGYTVNTSSNSATGTINDNDGIRIQAGQTSVDAAEGGAVNVVLEAVANGSVASGFAGTVAVIWDYSGMGITAMVADFDSSPSSVDFSTIGNGTATAAFTVADDTDIIAETYSIKLASAIGHTVIEPDNAATGNLTLLTPMLRLTSVTSSASEGGQIEVALAASSPFSQGRQQVLLRFSGTGITAGDLDGGLEIATTADFGSGTTATVSVNVLDDLLYEGVERYTLMLAKPSGVLSYNIDPDNLSAVGALVDAQSVPALSLTAVSTATEGNNIQLTVTSNIAIAATAPDIGFTLTFAARSGSGITGADFTNGLTQALTGVALLPEIVLTGESGTIATVSVATVNDALYEGDEDYTATLSAPIGATLDTDDSEDGTLTDNDTPILSLSGGGEITEGENIALTVTSNIAFASTAPAPVARLTVAGSEISNADFSGDWNDGTDDVSLNFSNMTAPVSIPSNDDTILERSEGYTVTLTAVANQAYTVDTNSNSATGSINANDGGIRIQTDMQNVDEGGNIAVALQAVASDGSVATGFSESISLTWGYSGTADEDDFSTVPPSVTFTNGVATATFVVKDDADAADEAYSIKLSTADGYTLRNSANAVTGTIAPLIPPTLSLATAPASATEGGDITLIITASKAFSTTAFTEIIVPLTFTGRSDSGLVAIAPDSDIGSSISSGVVNA